MWFGKFKFGIKMPAYDPKREHRMREYELQHGSCLRLNISLTTMTTNDPKRIFKTLMKLPLFIFLFCVSCVTFSNEDVWKPDPKFQLEDADYIQTLSWISGVSYTLSKLQTENMILCDGPESVGSKIIIDILNNEFTGEQISSEEAIEAIINELKSQYPCDEK